MTDKFSKAFDSMYKLGFKHGYTMAQKDLELKQLDEEIKELERIKKA